LEALRDGAVLRNDVKSAAKDEAISWGTLVRAKKKMGCIKAFKETGVDGQWFWKLNEFTRRKALVGADPIKIKEKVDRVIKEHMNEEEENESRPLAPNDA